jgi:hypothetical protein
MRKHLEPMFLKNRVSIVLAGHVHCYERTEPLYDHKTLAAAEGGVVYITIGNGGNREGHASDFIAQPEEWYGS